MSDQPRFVMGDPRSPYVLDRQNNEELSVRTCVVFLNKFHKANVALQAGYDETREKLSVARECCVDATGTPWLWGDDEHDDLESMSDGMLVTMTAGTLRALLRRAKDSNAD